MSRATNVQNCTQILVKTAIASKSKKRLILGFNCKQIKLQSWNFQHFLFKEGIIKKQKKDHFPYSLYMQVFLETGSIMIKIFTELSETKRKTQREIHLFGRQLSWKVYRAQRLSLVLRSIALLYMSYNYFKGILA